MEIAERVINQGVLWLRLIIEVTGALLIGLGVLIAVGKFLRTVFSGGSESFIAVRLVFAHYLGLALEFQLAADILSTAIAPSWSQIGQLAAIAVIRTGLNYFLSREVKEEEQEDAAHTAPQSSDSTP